MSKMPVVFIGHGSPMNAIEENKFTRGWRSMAQRIPNPKAILVISAHWCTKGTYVLDDDDQVSIYNESYVLGSLSMTSYLFHS